MKKKRFSVEQIVAVLKQAELGVPVAEVIRKAAFREFTSRTRNITYTKKVRSNQPPLRCCFADIRALADGMRHVGE